MPKKITRKSSSHNKSSRKPKSTAAKKAVATSISELHARQVLDSRGNPTVEADVILRNHAWGRGTVPSGASTGSHEALELRDHSPQEYQGKGVLHAVGNIGSIIAPRLVGIDALQQRKLDATMNKLDGTPNKGRLGANAILAVSMAAARAAAASQQLWLFQYLSRKAGKWKLPVPMMNVINGGKHAGNQLAIQEFLIEPVGAKSFAEGLRMGAEVYHSLKQVLEEKYGPAAINVGDEGGYAPPLQATSDALEAILAAIKKAGYDEKQLKLGMDAASSSFYEQGSYHIDGKTLSPGELEDYYEALASSYPLYTLEDPFAEDAFADSAHITARLGHKLRIIGDDLYVTNPERLQKGIELKATNAVLIKLNQIGSVTETLEAIRMAHAAAFAVIVSHRSGETEDTFIAHLATAVESAFIKAGAPARGERTAKYNELLRIEEMLGSRALYSGSLF